MKQKISTWCKIYKLVWNFDPWHLLLLSLLGLIQAASVILQIMAIQNFINYIQIERISKEKLLLNLLFVGLILLIRRLYNAYFNYNINKYIYIFKDIFQINFIKKTSKIPLDEFYKSEFETNKNMAQQGAESAALFLIISLMLLSFNIPYFIFIGIYYSLFSPSMLLVLIFIILPSFYSISKNMHEYKDLENNISVNRKKINYYYRCIGDISYIKETKILNAGKYFFKKIDYETDSYLSSTTKHSKLILKNSLVGESVKYIGYILIFIVLITLTHSGIITIGLLAATITSLNDMYSVFNDMLDRDFKSLSSFYYDVENYLRFFNNSFDVSTFNTYTNNGIDFKNVSFKYPNSKVYAIKNINLNIPKNQIIAIVGENAAGKTTFSRLLLGLLTPTKGKITIDSSIDNNINSKSSLFQNFAKYPFSLRDNVILSNTLTNPSDLEIRNILKQCGVDISDTKTFVKGLDTILSREFEGIDISGGQWQKLALARCIYRKHNIIVLDEPTSAIDPINESTLFSTFKEIAKNVTTIIITHRLGIVSIADYVIVMDNGEIIESGTHDELINLGGKYKEMYLAQSSAYFK
ncbi:ATP-binding cassette subfamily B protein [Lachnotalea glycerini]|uniref:ATP-binding cassette subfamily B protein n=1 Tax=Lachnotalea glycerini TaxID=1763509 RepID=A0A318EMX6_9FIRM|nr:ABC transporter ATP-binding protein [Lachnotalea glycerini]PXV86290.1 ATP-binding cassette subfamily B protein [Lachnotalea glycerini]